MEPVKADSLFLQPQELSVQLRPGVRQSFFITITRSSNHPITDLTMDASPLPVGVNITFIYSANRSPTVVEVRENHTDIVHNVCVKTCTETGDLFLGSCEGHRVSQGER